MSRLLAHAGPLGSVENVALGDLIESLPHELLLNHVLHVLDVNEGAIAAADAGTDRTAILIALSGFSFVVRNALRHGDFDFALVPRNDGAVATDQPNCDLSHGRPLTRELVGQVGHPSHGALEDETFGDIVRVILDEGFFDEQGKIIVGQLEAVPFANVLQKPCSHRVGDVRHERSILLVENILLLPGKEKVRQSSADFVGDVSQIELAFISLAARDNHLRKRRLHGGIAESISPGEAGFLIEGGGDQALQRKIFGEWDVAQHEILYVVGGPNVNRLLSLKRIWRKWL